MNILKDITITGINTENSFTSGEKICLGLIIGMIAWLIYNQ
jgi:hypothetical protein